VTKIRIILGITLLSLLLGLVLVACSGAQDPASGSNLDGKALVEERCTQCHGIGNITGAAKSAAGWQSTVDRMIGHGARLNNAEKTAVLKYLSETYPG
jgi:cytochrome c5